MTFLGYVRQEEFKIELLKSYLAMNSLVVWHSYKEAKWMR